MDKPWRLQILGGPHDGETRIVEPGSTFWREPDALPPVHWASTGPELQESITVAFTVYLVVKRSDGRRYLAHPSLRLP